jgi:transcriptional regulator with XRE-family HTH domain
MPRAPASEAARQQGQRLLLLREAMNLTQPALAEIMGCAPNTVSGYESGRTRIDILALQRFCDHTHVSADWIVSGILVSLPMDIAARIQTAQRAGMGVSQQKRGRPRKSDVPTVAEAPSWPPSPRPKLLHAKQAPYLAPPKSTRRDNTN